MREPVLIHFTAEELTRTSTGLPNEPDAESWANLVRLVADVLEPMREITGPLRVNSAYRSKEVNAAVGGVPTSQHVLGLAADVVPLSAGLERAFHAVGKSDIPFDQLIIEPTWLHVSVPKFGVKPRRQCLRAHREGGRMVYVKEKL